MVGFVGAYGLKIGEKSKMKKLFLVLTMSILFFATQVQAQSYETTTTLYCKMSNELVETFILDGQWQAGPYIQKYWIVKRITQHEYFIRVRLESVDGSTTMYFEFNNGWPCKLMTRQTPIQPESEIFTPVD